MLLMPPMPPMRQTMTLNDYGSRAKLIDTCQKLDIARMMTEYSASIKKEFENQGVEVEGIRISFVKSKTGNGGSRFWFKCPSCSRRVGILYHDSYGSFGCRVCLRLDYRSHRYKGMLEAAVAGIEPKRHNLKHKT